MRKRVVSRTIRFLKIKCLIYNRKAKEEVVYTVTKPLIGEVTEKDLDNIARQFITKNKIGVFLEVIESEIIKNKYTMSEEKFIAHADEYKIMEREGIKK